jgi:hypothetical protein
MSTLLSCSLRLTTPAKNLGRHILPPLNRISSRDSKTSLEQHLLMRQRLQRWKIYLLTLLGSENSDGAKDTWCSPHCLNAVHKAFFNYPILDFPTTIYVYISVYIPLVSRCICWDGNSGSWCEWDKNRQGKVFMGTLAGLSSRQPIWDRG